MILLRFTAHPCNLDRVFMKGSYINISIRLIGAILLCLSMVAYAQVRVPEAGLGGSIESKYLGDHVLIRVALQTSVWFKDAYIIVDYANPNALEMNGNVIQSLQFDEDDEFLQLLAPGFRLDIPRDAVLEETGPRTGQITGLYDNELEQMEVVAIVGWQILKDFNFALNIHSGSLVLTPSADVDAEEVSQRSEVFLRGLSVVRDSVYVPVLFRDEQRAFVKFNTAGYHTYVNSKIPDTLADVNELNIRLGQQPSLNVSGNVALFPRDIEQDEADRYEQEREREEEVRAQAEAANQEVPAHLIAKKPDIPSNPWLLTLGTGYLEGYLVEINPQGNYAAFTAIEPNQYSAADHEFYQAAAREDFEALNAYLSAHPQDRNVIEAVDLSFDIGLKSGIPDDEDLMEVLTYGIEAHKERRRFLYLTEFTQKIYTFGENCWKNRELNISVGEKALEYISFSQTPRFRQHIQLMLGDCYLAKEDSMTGWRYFLSAAFNGDPQLDPLVRHELGRAYEAQGRFRRAFANYLRALELKGGLPPNLVASANEAIERLTPQLDADDPLLSDLP